MFHLQFYYMGRIAYFHTVLAKISDFIDSLPCQSYSETTLWNLFHHHWEDLELSANRTPTQLIKYLVQNNLLNKVAFSDENGSVKVVLTRNTEDLFTICSGLKNNAYFSHYTAIFLHGLTLQIPKVLYLNLERAPSKTTTAGTLNQEGIDKAFSKEQRKASRYYSIPGTRIYTLSGKHTQRLGVIQEKSGDKNYAYTDLERTLIDSAIRPAYAGGVFEVLKAFQQSKDQLEVEKLCFYLTRLDYLYPYHQTLGFYLEKAGYGEEVLALFEEDKEFDFYLTYNMRNPEFDARWRLFYPRGFA